MKEKIVITGSNGLLGQKLVQLFVANNYDVIAMSKGKNRNSFTDGYEYINFNITNYDRLAVLFHRLKPHFIINSAALTNVDACELRKRECDEINLRAVEQLTEICKKENIHLIQISTDFVFDGKKGMYKETDKPNPINYYGLSKYKAEKAIRRANIEYTILRTILVYGIMDAPKKSNIVLWVKESLEANKEIKIVTDQYRMPTLTDDLAQACLSSVQKKAQGIYHISSNKLQSVYEIAQTIANTFSLNSNLILPITTDELRQRAKRPEKTGFIIDKALKELEFISASFEERLACFKKDVF
ncbi:MAG: SDR family oxidoreductase [Flavobacteriaceae bacterium]